MNSSNEENGIPAESGAPAPEAPAGTPAPAPGGDAPETPAAPEPPAERAGSGAPGPALLRFLTPAPGQQYEEEPFGELLLKYAAIAAVMFLAWAVTGYPASVEGRSAAALVFVVLFFALPRLFYIRYYRACRNREILADYAPATFTERVVYSTRRNVSSLFMSAYSGVIVFYALVARSRTVGCIILLAFIAFALLNYVLNMPGFSRLMNADARLAVHRFNRRFITCLLTGLVCFAAGYFLYVPGPDFAYARKVLFGVVNPEYSDSLFVTFLGTADYVVAAIDLALGALAPTPWYGPVLAILVALPMGIAGTHIAIVLSQLCLPFGEIRTIAGPQPWVKPRRSFLVRHWKSICLPLFLCAFLSAVYHYGAPLYLKYQEQLMVYNNTEIKPEAELIDGVRYRKGTLSAIDEAQKEGLGGFQDLLADSSHEINELFDALDAPAENFVAWFRARAGQYPFAAGDAQLKQSFVSTLRLRNLDNSLNNIRKDTAAMAEGILRETRKKIDEILAGNREDEKAEPRKLGQNIDSYLLYRLYTSNNVYFDLQSDERIQIRLPSTETVLIRDFDDAGAIWFKSPDSKVLQSIEDELFAGDAGAEAPEDAAPPVPPEENPEAQKEYSDALTAHLSARLDACRQLVTEELAKALRMPLDAESSGVKKPQPVNTAIEGAETNEYVPPEEGYDPEEDADGEEVPAGGETGEDAAPAD